MHQCNGASPRRSGGAYTVAVTAAVTEIKEACDELERAVRKRKIWVMSRRLFSFAQIVLEAALTPLSPVAIGLVVVGLAEFTANEMLSDPEKPESWAPDLAMLLDVQHELDLGNMRANIDVCDDSLPNIGDANLVE